MLIIFLIFVALLIGFIKAISFSVWNFRSKNVVGGISVLFLTVLIVFSGMVLLR